jgi:hypothetical protein
MAEELGRIVKPSAEEYKGGRNVFFVPLLFCPPGVPLEFLEKVNRYWDEVEAQVSNLESKLGTVKKVYHELIPVGDEDGARAIEELNDASHQVVRRRLEKEARLQPIEDLELLTEFMDWSRCLTVGLQNQKVFNKIHELYSEAQRNRYEDIARKLDESLEEGECGLLLMREGHRVQFPASIQVLYVSPPSLDEINRWLRDREKEAMAEAEQAMAKAAEESGAQDEQAPQPEGNA